MVTKQRHTNTNNAWARVRSNPRKWFGRSQKGGLGRALEKGSAEPKKMFGPNPRKGSVEPYQRVRRRGFVEPKTPSSKAKTPLPNPPPEPSAGLRRTPSPNPFRTLHGHFPNHQRTKHTEGDRQDPMRGRPRKNEAWLGTRTIALVRGLRGTSVTPASQFVSEH